LSHEGGPDAEKIRVAMPGPPAGGFRSTWGARVSTSSGRATECPLNPSWKIVARRCGVFLFYARARSRAPPRGGPFRVWCGCGVLGRATGGALRCPSTWPQDRAPHQSSLQTPLSTSSAALPLPHQPLAPPPSDRAARRFSSSPSPNPRPARSADLPHAPTPASPLVRPPPTLTTSTPPAPTYRTTPPGGGTLFFAAWPGAVLFAASFRG